NIFEHNNSVWRSCEPNISFRAFRANFLFTCEDWNRQKLTFPESRGIIPVERLQIAKVVPLAMANGVEYKLKKKDTNRANGSFQAIPSDINNNNNSVGGGGGPKPMVSGQSNRIGSMRYGSMTPTAGPSPRPYTNGPGPIMPTRSNSFYSQKAHVFAQDKFVVKEKATRALAAKNAKLSQTAAEATWSE
ncbi:hypothetical protein Tco_1408971, partial [Tanacetum coccineum]